MYTKLEVRKQQEKIGPVDDQVGNDGDDDSYDKVEYSDTGIRRFAGFKVEKK
jgi:hypothetical protein